MGPNIGLSGGDAIRKTEPTILIKRPTLVARIVTLASPLVLGASAIVGLSFLPAAYFPALDPFVNLAHIFAGLFLLMIVVVLVVRRRFAYLLLGIFALAGPASLVAPEVLAALITPHVEADDRASLKVIAANVWTKNFQYDAFRKLVDDEQPDIVFLQETFKGWRAVLQEMAPGYRVVAGCYWPHECNAVILTRLQQIGKSDPYDSSHVTARLRLPDELGGGVLEATSIHLSRPPPIDPQLEEVEQLEKLAASFGERAVMGGDFNATPWSSTIRRLDHSLSIKRATRLMPSWPAAFPIAPVDHVFVGRAWDVVDVRLGPSIGSDHRPVIATLSLRPEAGSGTRDR